MIKLFATAGSFVLGGAGVALVGYLSANPLAFTHPIGSPPLPSVQRSIAVDAPVNGEALVLPDVMMLPEVVIRASLPTREKAPRPLGPCSDWSDVGAKFIAQDGATGVRHVRQLCEEMPPPSRSR